MAEARKIVTDFTGGEVGDRLMARIDTPIYNRTCRTLENFLVHASGGLDFAPGTVFICEAKTHTTPVQLLPFEVSASEKYVLELSETACRFYKNKARLLDGANPLEIVTPWAGADLAGLQTTQQEYKIYLAHGLYQLHGLKNYGDLLWNLNSADLDVCLAVAHNVSPYITAYAYTGDVFTKRPNPDTLPAGIGWSCAVSSDGMYLAVAHTTTPFVTIYKRSGDTFTKLANPATLPGTSGNGCAFSVDSMYLAVAHSTTPFVTIYKRSGDTFTKLADPADLPPNTGLSCSFSEDGTYLAVGNITTTPFITIYKRSGDTFTKLANPATLPTGSGYGCMFSKNGVYLAVAHTTTPFITIYKRNADTFTKLANPGTLPAGNGFTCGFCADGVYLAVGHSLTPFVTLYKRSGDTFTKLANPGTLPAGDGRGCSFSANSIYLAVAHSTTPFVTIYKRSGDTFTKLANPGTLPAGDAYGCAFVPDAWEGVSWGSQYPAALTFHDQRLILGRDQRVRGSRTGWPQNFLLDAADNAAAYEYTLASDLLEEIVWMRTKDHRIVIGTSHGEWPMSGGDAPITGANVYTDRVSAHGSAGVAAILANESLLFVQKGGQRLREFMYSMERGGYISPDLTLLADHIGEKGLLEFAWQRSPRSLLWVRLCNDELATLTLDRNNNIVAWSRQPRDGLVKSIAVVSGDATNPEDTIYLCVQRVIDGVTKQYIEYMKPINRPADEDDYFYVDCGTTFDYSATIDTMEGATKASPVVVSAAFHPFVNDEFVRITGVVGMTQLNGNTYMVKNKVAGVYLAVAHATTPFITIYKRSGDTFTKLDNPATLPTGQGWGCAFSTDGVYLAVAHATTPWVTIYKRSGDTFTKLADPATLPTGQGTGCCFSSDGVYLAVAHDASPFVTIYKRSGDVFTKLANPAELPTGHAIDCAFSADGVYLAVEHDASPFVTIYKRSGDVFTKLANPAELPIGTGWGCTFSPDGVYLVVTHLDTPFVTIYKRSGDIFTKLANPAELPTGTALDCAFSTDGVYLAVAHVTTPFITIYKRSGDVFTKLGDPATLPTGEAYDCAFSADGVYLAVAHLTTPFITIYKRSGDTFTKLADPATLPTNTGWSCAFAVDTFELYLTDGVTPLNGTAFGIWTSGGLCEKVVKDLSGLDHLKLKTVAVYADGEALGQEVVSSGGTITIDTYAAKIHVGLPRTGKIWTQRLGHFSPVRIPEATLLLYKSRGGKIGADVASLKAIRYASDTLLTGPQEVRIGGTFSREGSIMIVQDQPLPMTVLGIVAEIVAGE